LSGGIAKPQGSAKQRKRKLETSTTFASTHRYSDKDKKGKEEGQRGPAFACGVTCARPQRGKKKKGGM